MKLGRMIEVSLMGKISFHLKQRTERQKEKQNRCNELDSKILIKFELIWKQGINLRELFQYIKK
jgi:hypothetical protein